MACSLPLGLLMPAVLLSRHAACPCWLFLFPACSFEWVTCDISSDKELEEIHDLLGAHYVEVRALLLAHLECRSAAFTNTCWGRTMRR